MPGHLTDVACLEWVRQRRIVLAPETTSGVEIHADTQYDQASINELAYLWEGDPE